MGNQTQIVVHSRSKNGTPLYEKACPDCGAISIVDKRKFGMRCMACASKARRTHGMSVGGRPHPLYRMWSNMKTRCYNPNATHYEYYGGRGIGMDSEWRSNNESFFAWALKNGWQEGLEIDRMDVDQGYTPENCRFITHQENSQTTRRIKTTHFKAKKVKELLSSGKSIRQIADEAGVTYMVAWHISKKNSWANV